MKLLIALLFMSTLMFAEDKPKLPVVPAQNASDIQAAAIEAQSYQLQLKALEQQYRQVGDASNQALAKMQAAKQKALTDMKLDPKEFDINITSAGKVEVIELPKKAEEKK